MFYVEGKRGRGKPRMMMLDDINADETNDKIKGRAMDRNVRVTGWIELAFKKDTNDDENLK